MIILKFGGSSLSNRDRIIDVGQIILNAARGKDVIVVVSALQGVTNQLLECARLAAKGNQEYLKLFHHLYERHESLLGTLHGAKCPTDVADRLQETLNDLHGILRGIELIHHCPPMIADLVGSFGERLSALIVASYINKKRAAIDVDARQFIITDDDFTHASVFMEETHRAIQSFFRKKTSVLPKKVIPIVTGFIGSTRDGQTTTIGRNGSDYTAAILGAALRASVIEIWTDVDGIMSADPHAVPGAFVIPEMSYEEAMELSYFGAKVLHPSAIAPAVAKRIPILIKNTLYPEAPGTLITHRAENWEGVAKGISSVDDVTLLTLRGLSMVGVPGTAERLFRALAQRKVNVILISQASSEHTICFAVKNEHVAQARMAVEDEFENEIGKGLTKLDKTPDQTIVAIVGEGMRGTAGVSGKVFQALGRNNVNVTAIAQGASERNISFVIHSERRIGALNAIHEAFFEKKKRLYLAIIGVGNIGSSLLRQLHQQTKALSEQGFDVRVCCVANSKTYVLRREGINLARWKEDLERSVSPMNALHLAEEIAKLEFTNLALIDCTASTDLVKTYQAFVRANAHIITPNKKANVLPTKEYNALMQLLRQRQKHFLYEANVGAGLPVISTLRDLLASGDEIVRIEGILSGTLSYLFNHFDGFKPFSAIVREAHELGFTEPDPREDLSGQDVARKLLILARQIGLKLDLKDVKFENLVPQALRRGSFTPEFYSRFSEHDRVMEKKLDQAVLNKAVLRYVGVLENNKASAGLREIPATHPFASTKGSDNILAFTTHRYSQTPLVVQGPGAGADVTAMGVFSDILKLLHYLPY